MNCIPGSLEKALNNIWTLVKEQQLSAIMKHDKYNILILEGSGGGALRSELPRLDD